MTTGKPLPPAAQRVQDAIHASGFDFTVRIMPDSTRSSAEAAAAVGCAVGQIAKSLIFRTKKTGRAVLVIASGANRVDEKAVARVLGEKLGKADADFVRAETGFAIGGVSPAGLAKPLPTFIDADLLEYEQIWAAAGTPHAVFPLPPSALVDLTGGTVLELKKTPRSEP